MNRAKLLGLHEILSWGQGVSYGKSTGGALVYAGRELSNPEVSRRAAGMAAALEHGGLRPGARVALATADSSAFFVAFAACLASGFTAIVIDPKATPDEIARMLARAVPSAMIGDAEVLHALADRKIAPLTKISVGSSEGASASRVGGWLSRFVGKNPAANVTEFTVVTRDDGELAWREVSDSTPAYVMFTSGTTSKPKGVVISRRALFQHVRTLVKVFDYGPQATLLHYLPLHHTDGLVHGPAVALLTGMRVVLPGAFSAHVAERMPDLIRDHRVTHFLAVPTILTIVHRIFQERPDLFQTQWFRHAISTAGYLNEELWRNFERTFGLRLSNFYGMTETVSGSLYCGPSDATYRRGTLGKPVDSVLRIVDVHGHPCNEGAVGLLEISGDHVMDGYLSDAEATAAVLRRGWLDTGDLFRRDAEGFFEFVGRKKTVIKRGGITIYPEDIRGALEALSWVREVEVIGAPDPTFEQIIIVCAVVEPGKNVADVRAACTQHLAPERRPDRIQLMSSLPRGPSGKVRREVLLERVTRDREGSRDQHAIANQVRELAAEIFQVDPASLSDESGPDDVLNWDSYAHVELVMALEKNFDMRLTPKEFMQLRTLRQASEIVTRRLRREGP
jgi:long-chain acyl-CoA synthetase